MGKKSFVLHIDSLEVLDDMPDDFAGKLFKVIKHFQSTGQTPDMDFALRMAAMPFIKQFERDAAKYLETVEANRVNGQKGGRPNKPKQTEPNPNNPLGFSETELNLTKAKKGDSDSVNDSESDSITADAEFELFWNLYQKKTERKVTIRVWSRLSKSNKAKVLSVVAAYVLSTPDPKFRKNPATWLNGECWNDEIKAPVQKLKMPYL